MELLNTEEEVAVMELILKAPAVIVDSDEACIRASDMSKELTKWLGKLDKARDKAKRPHLTAGKAIDTFAKVLSVPMKECVAQLRKAQTTYAIEVEKKRQAVMLEQQALEDEARDRAEENETVPEMTQAVAEIPDAPPVRTRKVTEMVIYDIDKIPEEYWEINEKAVRAALKDGIDVPGARMETVRKVQ